MKKLARKFLAMLMTVVIAVSGIVATSVPAAAESLFDGAVELKAKEIVSTDKIKSAVYYKIDIPREGTFTLNSSTNYCSVFSIVTYDNETLYSSDRSASSFKVSDLKKGSYYLRVSNGFDFGSSYVRDMYYTFVPNEKPVISFGVTLKKGDKIQFDAVTENYDGKVTWLSTKKTVATVSSKGLVTAKKAGTTYIRAQLDNGDYVEIKVVVKNK